MRQERTLLVLEFLKIFYPCIALFQLINISDTKKDRQHHSDVKIKYFNEIFNILPGENYFKIIINFYPLKIMAKPKSTCFCLLQSINLFN